MNHESMKFCLCTGTAPATLTLSNLAHHSQNSGSAIQSLNLIYKFAQIDQSTKSFACIACNIPPILILK